MGFTEFYFVLFPSILTLFYLVRYFNLELSKYVILFSSVIFLFYVDIISFILLLTMVIINYTLIHFIRDGFNKNLFRTLGIVLSLSPLVLYKFSFFNVGVIKQLESGTVSSIAIPLGLAFYALQQITALFDTTKKNVSKPTLKNYLLFSFFFVYLPSGPLTPYGKVIPQFETMGQEKIPIKQINIGISLFIVGFAKKILLADPIGEWIGVFYTLDQKLDKEIVFSIFELSYIAWGSVLEFYFIFSAYSDMAIGMALCFGILLPINFNSPLKAKSPMEYINSWHMSIMAFVREYVFQPVYMKFKKLPIKEMKKRYIVAWTIAVFATFFTVGVWHAPTQSSIFLSVIVSLILVTIELSRKFVILPSFFNLMGLSTLFSRLFLLFVIIVTAVAFRIPSDLNFIDFFVDGYKHFYISLPQRFSGHFLFFEGYRVNFHGIFPSIQYLTYIDIIKPTLSSLNAILHLIIGTFIVFFMPNSMEMFNLVKTDKFSIVDIKWVNTNSFVLLLSILFCLSILLFSNNAGFIYG